MNDPRFDYHFGWRWLLPLQGCQQVALKGFKNEEHRIWLNELGGRATEGNEQTADAWIVDAEGCEPPDFNTLTQVRMVCVVGAGKKVRRWRNVLEEAFSKIREYGLLPAEQPRMVVPLNFRFHTATALRLHRPGRIIARIGIAIARLLTGIGVFSILRKRALLVAVKEPEAIPIVAEAAELPLRMGESDLDYALYLGTQNENRKTVILPLGTSKPTTILKVATTPKARESLKNEAASLLMLKDSHISHNIPALTRVVENGETLTLYQEYRARRSINRRKLDAMVIEFLAQLSCIGRRPRLLASILDELAPSRVDLKDKETSKAFHLIWARLQQLTQKEAVLWEHLSHGDFAPWNCAWTDKGLFVFDWEACNLQDLAFADAFYYTVAPALHIGRAHNSAPTVQNVLDTAARVAFNAGIEDANVKVYFAIWLIYRLDENPLYGLMLRELERIWE